MKKLLLVFLSCVLLSFLARKRGGVQAEEIVVNEQVLECYKNLNLTLEWQTSNALVLGSNIQDICGDFGTCYAPTKSKSTCFCTGHKGEYCTEKVVPLTSSYAISFVIVFVTIVTSLLSICCIRRKNATYNTFRQDYGRSFQYRFGQTTKTKWIMIFAWRLMMLLFTLAIHINVLVNLRKRSYIFYTIQSFILLIIVLSLGAFLAGKGTGQANVPFYQNLHALHSVLFEVVITAATVVDIVYWLLLYDAGSPIGYTNFIQHAVNLMILVVDFVIVNHKFYYFHTFFVILWPCFYAIFHFSFTLSRDQAFGHAPVYPFLDMSLAITPAFALGVLLIHPIIFCVYAFISRRLERYSYVNHEYRKQRNSSDISKVESLKKPRPDSEVIITKYHGLVGQQQQQQIPVAEEAKVKAEAEVLVVNDHDYDDIKLENLIKPSLLLEPIPDRKSTRAENVD